MAGHTFRPHTRLATVLEIYHTITPCGLIKVSSYLTALHTIAKLHNCTVYAFNDVMNAVYTDAT